MREKTKSFRRFFLGAICILLLLFAILVTALGVWAERTFASGVSLDLLAHVEESTAPPVFYQFHFTDRANRIGTEEMIDQPGVAETKSNYLSYSEIPDNMIRAVVAIEDKRFFDHRGVDWYRTAAAGLNYVLGFSKRFGASTITQQLVKNLTGENEITVHRKLQEVFFARDLERNLDKTEILERYLNLLPLSDGCVGIAVGAEHFFGKSAAELTLSECATLAAITNNPSYYHPTKYPDHTIERRNLILSEMQKQGYISEETYQTAVSEPLGIVEKQKTAYTEPIRSWYLDMVVDDVVTDLAAQYGISRAAASQKVLAGGLRIDVAMDEDIQKEVENYYRAAVQMPKNEKGESAQSALIVIDPKTGDILGVAGAVGEKTANRLQNFATQTKRAPGSVIKPLTVYGPALESGVITWASVYDDVPVEFKGASNRAWPRNASGVYRGLTTIPYAVAHSVNTVAVRVLQDVGAENAFRFAKDRFHVDSLLEGEEMNDTNSAALALGQMHYGVTLREITTAYTVFADGGVYHPYRSYYRVVDANGKILLSREDGAEQVMSEENAAIMTKLLQGVIQHGTSTSVSLDKICECAGKTGTTSEHNDRWFIGYTPDLICGVWCGFEYPEPIKGSNPCLSVWNTVMHRLVTMRQGQTIFRVPQNLIQCAYCKDSGCRVGSFCAMDPRGSRNETGWFVSGTEPTAVCDCHVPVSVNPSGGVCGADCPVGDSKRAALIRVVRHFPVQVTVSDAQYVWRGDPKIIATNPNSAEAYFEASLPDYCGRSATQTPYNRSCRGHTIEYLTPWDIERLFPKFFFSHSDSNFEEEPNEVDEE